MLYTRDAEGQINFLLWLFGLYIVRALLLYEFGCVEPNFCFFVIGEIALGRKSLFVYFLRFKKIKFFVVFVRRPIKTFVFARLNYLLRLVLVRHVQKYRFFPRARSLLPQPPPLEHFLLYQY